MKNTVISLCKRTPWFDYAESLIQIAIVLTSVGIVLGSMVFIWASLGLGGFGILLGLNGFFLVV